MPELCLSLPKQRRSWLCEHKLQHSRGRTEVMTDIVVLADGNVMWPSTIPP